MENEQQLKDNWYKINAPIGRDLGYPKCCIKEFCDMPPELMKGKATKEEKKRYKAGCLNGEFTGFIPCLKHANQILNGEITLELLIDYGRRDLFLPHFPNAK